MRYSNRIMLILGIKYRVYWSNNRSLNIKITFSQTGNSFDTLTNIEPSATKTIYYSL